MLILDAGYVGEVVRGDPFSIQVNTLTATGTLTAGFTGPGGTGLPTIRWREVASGSTGTTGLSFTPNVPANGLHRITLDTSTLTTTLDYAIEVAAGEVDGNTVDNHMLGSFTCSGKAAGRLYEQAVKCDSGTLFSGDSQRTFVLEGTDINDNVDDFYKAQVLKFSPGAANANIGRTILSSTATGAGTDRCTVTVQSPFPTNGLAGDPFVILPEERELTVYTCNITVEFGISSGVGDRYSVEWFGNGHPLTNADQIVDPMRLTVFRWSDDTQIFTNSYPTGSVSWAPNASIFKFTDNPANAIPANEGVTMRVRGTIDGIEEEFSRTLFNFA